MARTLGLGGFAPGDSFSLSVTQDGQTAGPVVIPAWGQSQSGGTITINADRTVLQCAPDSVRFSVDLSQATFNAQGPTGSNVYDARMHDLIYLWDFGDTGDWTAPVNVLPEWKARTTAKGPFVAHMYRAADTYEVTLTVFEPSSGKSSTAGVSIVVADPDVVYAGARTFVINPVGDADFIGAPSGATQINANTITTGTQPWLSITSATDVRRVLLKRGGTYTVNLNFVRDYGGLLFGAYGTGDDPIINSVYTNPSATGGNRILYGTGAWTGISNKDVRVEYWNLVGNFDPTSELAGPVDTTVKTIGLSRFDLPVDYMLHSITSSGTARSVSYTQQEDRALKTNFHADNCSSTDFGGQYPWFFGPHQHAEGSTAFTGCRFDQNPMAADDRNVRAVIRSEHAQNVHMRGCDMFAVDTTQPVIKLIETASADGTTINVHSSTFEGGLHPVSFSNNTSQSFDQRSTAHNAILDGIITIGAHKTFYMIGCVISGLTLRNSLAIQPGMPKSGGAGLRGVLTITDFSTNPIPQWVLETPIRAYNNTLINHRTKAENGTSGDAVIVDDLSDYNGGYTAITGSNNVEHQPDAGTPQVSFAPLSSTVLFAPRNIGWVNPADFVFDGQNASPDTEIWEGRPETGSSAIGAALQGDVSYQDILLQARPEPPSKGAWEMK